MEYVKRTAASFSLKLHSLNITILYLYNFMLVNCMYFRIVIISMRTIQYLVQLNGLIIHKIYR